MPFMLFEIGEREIDINCKREKLTTYFKLTRRLQIMNEQKKLINETKRCSKCNRELPISEFANNKAQKDGLQCWCKECYNGYKQTHKQYINQYQKDYQNQFKGYYLYIIKDKNNKIVYVGQTSNYYNRLTTHLSGGSNATKELFANNEWACIKYLDVGDIVSNDLELRALENALIELYNPRLNTVKNIIRDIDKDRLFSLVATLHNILNEWITFKTNYN